MNYSTKCTGKGNKPKAQYTTSSHCSSVFSFTVTIHAPPPAKRALLQKQTTYREKAIFGLHFSAVLW